MALEATLAAAPSPRSDLARRLATAAVGLPPAVWMVWHGGWAAALLMSFASLLATYEFVTVAKGRLAGSDAPALAAAAALPWLPVAAPGSAAAIALVLVALVSFASWALPVARQDVAAAERAPLGVQAVVFCALGPFFLVSLRALPRGEAWALSVAAATFGNDAAAYLFGRRLGRTRMAPRVSPGKTWEGFFAGALASLLLAAAAQKLFPGALRVRDALVIGAVCAVVGPLGDLSKSLLKRSRKVKDAGRLLPGHGGMLDRIDALVVNVVAVWAWASWGP